MSVVLLGIALIPLAAAISEEKWDIVRFIICEKKYNVFRKPSFDSSTTYIQLILGESFDDDNYIYVKNYLIKNYPNHSKLSL